MLKVLTTFLLVALFISLTFATTFNEEYHVPNSIIVCFDAKSIDSTIGDITVAKNLKDQIQIGLSSFDSLAVNYDFTDIKRLCQVKTPNGVMTREHIP